MGPKMIDQEVKDDAGSEKIPEFDVDVPQMLKAEGFQIKDINDDGSIVAIGIDGSTYDIDTQKMASDLLGDDAIGAKLNLSYNSPKTAIARSPVDATDRAKLSVGNTRGSLSYLSSKFGKDNVQLDEKNGLVVKQNGIWKQVDPSGFNQYFNDPWELTRDLADLGDVAVNVAATSYGAAKGAIAGAPAGPAGVIGGGIIGAGASGAASGAFRTLLGRAVGTYEADVNETITDIGLEGLFSMGGQALGAGVKPTIQGLGKAIKSVSSKASDGTKAVLAGTYGQLTGAGSEAMEQVLNRPGEWTGKMNSYIKKGLSGDQIAREALDSGVKSTEELLEKATKALPQKWGQLMDDLAKKSGSKLSVNMDDVLTKAASGLDDAGVGQVVRDGSALKFIPFDDAAKAARLEAGLPVSIVDDATQKELQNLVTKISSFGGKSYKGEGAARVLIGLNKTINQLSDDAVKGGMSPEAQRAVTKFAGSYKNALADTFTDAGLGLEYKAMQDVYRRYADPVKIARQALKSSQPEAIDQVFKRITGSSTKNAGTKRAVDELVDLVGPEGKKLMDKIAMDYTISKTANWAPRMGLVSGVALGSTLAGGASVGLPGAALAMTQSSPRFVANQLAAGRKILTKVGSGTSSVANPLVQYSLKTLDTIKGLSPAATTELLQNTDLFKALMESPINSLQEEDKLNQEAGAFIEESLK